MTGRAKADYKQTLNLPKTTFPMKANLGKREPEILKFWDKQDVYKRLCESQQGKPLFVLHDGPPYANGDIHVGTAFNKILKDIIVKYKAMSGHFAPYVPGWDCHGQPIEHEVEKKLGKEAGKITQADLRKKCRNYALKFVDRQSNQFRRLGVLGDFKDPYLTLDHSYEATNVKVFKELYLKGLVYKGRKPIHWCYNCKTALAEAEIEYRDEKSPSIYVKFPLAGDSLEKLSSLLGEHPTSVIQHPTFFLIWTTTPWTLPANVAVAVHPKADYALCRVGSEVYILAGDLISQVFKEAKVEEKYEVLASVKGKELEGMKCKHPLRDFDSRIILADFVALDQGTGCVHIAPGHGQEDYLVGLQYNLSQPMPVNEEGIFTGEEAGKFKGEHIEKANPQIIGYLGACGLLFKSSTALHSYPHCWRCKQPVIFRSTEQWFISMDKEGFRRDCLKAISGVSWIPSWSIRRIASMIEVRPDWCISRQRAWGVPIPIFYCEDCNGVLGTKESFEAVEALFEKEGADAWFVKEACEILPEGITCPHCGGRSFRKEKDILDVWFESGISHEAVLKDRPELAWPADLYVEGSDQHRGWFQSSLLASIGSTGSAPYRAVLTHGFVVDGEGRKMSKSLGNVVDPLEVIDKSGADILRLWAASADYASDVAISPEILKRTSEAYRRIRNTFRFILGNLYDFDPEEDSLDYEDLEEIDRWALLKTYEFLSKVTEAYQDYRFYLAFHTIYNFCVVDMSSFYLDVLKDRLYTSYATSSLRRSAQTVLFEILKSLVRVISPILSFTAEEVWQLIPEGGREAPSVFLCSWPKMEDKYLDENLKKRWGKLLTLREEVLRALEIAREKNLIGDSLEAAVTIYSSDELCQFLQTYEKDLPMIFIVSAVNLESASAKVPVEAYVSESIKELKILVSHASGEKCERCWNYSQSVGEDRRHLKLCARCVEVISDWEKEA